MICQTYKSALLVSLVCLLPVGNAEAETITLLNGTATFSQTASGPHSPDLSVDGDFSAENNGWAIGSPASGDITTDQTAVWETGSDVSTGIINFAMHHNFSVGNHLIGRLRFSVTSDDRSTFADGEDNGGAVAANWTVLTNPTSSGSAGISFTTQVDNSILVGGTIPGTGTYDIQYAGVFMDITGIRLEVMEHPTLPFSGPGLYPVNGNFVLTELVMTTIIPEPGTAALLISLGLLGVARHRRAA